MKKYLLIAAMIVSGFSFAQTTEPVLEAEGQLVKATYYHDNGNVQQVGYFKDGKLDGKWTSYDANGNVNTIAKYTNGEKSGKWMYYSNNRTTAEVDYTANKLVGVKKFSQNAVAVKN